MSHDCPTPFSPKATPQLILAFILTFGLFVAPTYAIRIASRATRSPSELLPTAR
jgi:hypothetical protein